MRKALVASVAVLAALGALLVRAADHLDGPAAKADPTSDITDVYAWMSSDASRVYLVMNVVPLASATTSKFSNTVQYVFHVTSRSAYGQTAGSSTNIICTFDSSQKISCWAGSEYVNGDASNPAKPLSSSDGKLTVFAGPRADPFFFNLDGFNAARLITIGVESSLNFNDAGCPALPPGNAVAVQLGKAPDAGAPQDFFAGLDVLSIVLSIDKTLVTQGGPIVGVWGSTNKP